MSMNYNNPMSPMQVPLDLGGSSPGQASLDYLRKQVAHLNQTYTTYLNPNTSPDFLVAHPYLTAALGTMAGGVLGAKTGGPLGAMMMGGMGGLGAAGIRQSHINNFQQNYNTQSQNLMNAWSKLLPLYMAHGDANAVNALPNNLSTIANNQYQFTRNTASQSSPQSQPMQSQPLRNNSTFQPSQMPIFNQSYTPPSILQNTSDINSPSTGAALGSAYRQAVVDPMNTGTNAAKAPANISQSYAQAAQARANALRTMVQSQSIQQNPVSD